jgi:hypothetical protein
MLRIPHCLDNRLRDGGKVVSPTHQSPKIYNFMILVLYLQYYWVTSNRLVFAIVNSTSNEEYFKVIVIAVIIIIIIIISSSSSSSSSSSKIICF